MKHKTINNHLIMAAFYLHQHHSLHSLCSTHCLICLSYPEIYSFSRFQFSSSSSANESSSTADLLWSQ